MKMSSVFDLITDANDLLYFFEGVETNEQLISRLERLKRANPEDLLACIEALRMSVPQILNDTLEMNASDPTQDDETEDHLGLDDFGEEENNTEPEDEKDQPKDPEILNQPD